MRLLIHTLYINATWQLWQVFAPPYLISTTGLSPTGHQHARGKIVPSGNASFITPQASQKAKTVACSHSLWCILELRRFKCLQP